MSNSFQTYSYSARTALAIVGSLLTVVAGFAIYLCGVFLLLTGMGYEWPHASGLWVWLLAASALLWPLPYPMAAVWLVKNAWGIK